MQVMKWSLIALAVAGSTQMAVASEQSDAKGFVEDSSLSVLARNLYFSRDRRNNDRDDEGNRQSRVEEWGQGFIGTFESGFTQGTVGFGVDAIGLAGIKLDSGRGRVGTGLFPTDSEGRSEDSYGEAGGAVKVRFSNTTLKYGDQFTTMPVFATDDSRLLPEVAEGFQITSNEIAGLELKAGHFTGINAQDSTNHDGLGLTKADVFGGTYAFSDALTTTLYFSRIEDYFKKIYANVNWTLPITDGQAFGLDFNAYKVDSIGKGLADGDNTTDGGDIDNLTYSFAASYSIDAHKFTLSFQDVTGDGDYAYGVDGGGSVYLNNSIARSDFNTEDEKSYGARYDLDFTTFGVPGLTFMTRYVYGTGANVASTDNGKEWERDIDVKYVFQDGPAKDLSLRVRQATYRSSDAVYLRGSPSLDELRLIVEYPLSIL